MQKSLAFGSGSCDDVCMTTTGNLIRTGVQFPEIPVGGMIETLPQAPGSPVVFWPEPETGEFDERHLYLAAQG